MPVVLVGLAYIGGVFGFAFITLSLACGLYYLAELVEEYTVATRRLIKYTTIATMISHVLLWLVDGMPFKRIAFSLVCHVWYTQLLAGFPAIELFSVAFIGSCALAITDHFVWFFYFTQNYHSFMEICTFFGLIVWLVPFMYFISLSANEYTLPAFGKFEFITCGRRHCGSAGRTLRCCPLTDPPPSPLSTDQSRRASHPPMQPTDASTRKKKGNLKAFLHFLYSTTFPTRNNKAF
ncbi:transmembrane adaptor Erv26-domain-containing protein [Blyttiomyces helicus]|uniref:Transmembrane adaptor Erv26-domain-containing protein n=1 Tax=Blyttiomyces helicus TaxID=388810 RepID=A0A4P9WIZ2_9FUNG|nr:transmembrane adaptor Erv26-domain-containing protein [Blyttiomyces helicus]|eukprot:RKO92784.1 transmembrane adaptor Erv26-domain-containing protein [Blyttiomyces helicus]